MRLRSVLDLVDGGAESPRESRLRLLLIRAGLPRPETQIAFRDLRIRVDMGWRRWQVAVEYDGAQHWTDPRQRSWDIDRIALLDNCSIACPRHSMAPAVGSTSRNTVLAIVDLPQPLSPTSPSVSPSAIAKLTSSTACTTARERPRNRLGDA